MDFLIDNIFLVALAVGSGLMLLVSGARGGSRADAVGPTDATQMVNQRQAVFVDVRTPELFAAGHIAQSRNVPEAELAQKSASLPKNRPLILVCGNGRDSAKVVKRFKEQGFAEVVSLAGGLTGWVQAGLPMARQ